jgi:hypothetical protein
MGPVTVIMVSYRTGPALFDAIRHVTSDPCVGELILVDNDNPSDARVALQSLIEDLDKGRLLQGHGNIGFAQACNYGASFARCEALLFLNPDAIVQAGSIEALLRAGRSLPDPWIAGGLLLDESGREQRGSRRGELTLLSALCVFTGLHHLPGWPRFHRNKEPLPDQPVPMPTLSGAFLMMSQTGFEQVGGFDPHYFLHVEDIDLCRRVRRMGGTVMFVPAATVIHHGATSDAPTWQVERHKLDGFLRYFWTAGPGLGPKLSTLILAPFIGAAVIGRTLFRAMKS